MDDRLRPLWNFDDLDGSEATFREQLAGEMSDAGRAEVLTQLARIQGLRDAFEAGDALLDEASRLGSGTRSVEARVDLERGRLRRSSGDLNAARPLFESAYAGGLDTEQYFLAADAAHMAALVAGDRDRFVEWTQRGIEVAERNDPAAYWLGPLLNNLGWEHYGAGDSEQALDAFERALRARERDGSNAQAIEIARYAVGKTLHALGRTGEAIPLLERAVAWAEDEGAPDGWFHEELAAEYAAVGRDADARAQAALAIPLLERDDPSFAEDAERSGRLAALAST
ncbi:MAG TPA: tetratricopeptide repeat protein [Gaiellaceae bacterium]|nr:tetratricopeptide repeat protein [Gaiellaceae bacterium]